MDSFDDDDDIQIPPIITDGGGPTTVPPPLQTPAGVPLIPASGSNRRRISFEVDETAEAVRRSLDELEQDDEISDILNQGIPLKSKTPKKNVVSDTDLDRDLWADCDRGMAAQRRLTGTHVAWSSAQRIIYIIMQLVPVHLFAPDLYDWNKTKHSTLMKLASTYQLLRPSVVTMLTEATANEGEKSRDLIDKAKQTMFGSEAIHDIAIYALQIYYWAVHDDSKKQDIIDNAIDDYLRTPDSQIDSLLRSSEKGTYLNIDDDLDALEGAWKLPGMRRLNYQENAKFTQAWLDLWTVCINLLCYKEADKTDVGEIHRALTSYLIESRDHPDAIQAKPIHLVHATQRQKFIKLAEMCKRVHMPERIPDTYQRATNFLCAIDELTFKKMEKMIEDNDEITDHEMTYKTTVEMCLLAESRVRKKVSAMAQAKKIRSAPKAEGEKEKKKKKIEDKKIEEKEKEPPKKKEEKPISKLTFLTLPSELKGLSKEENQALSKKYYEERKCKNCGQFDPDFPSHRSSECPYEMRHGYPWPEDHIPVKRIADAPATAAPIIMPEDDDEVPQGTRSIHPGNAGGIKTGFPIIVDEQFQFVETTTTLTAIIKLNEWFIHPMVYLCGFIFHPILLIIGFISCFSQTAFKASKALMGGVPPEAYRMITMAAFGIVIASIIAAFGIHMWTSPYDNHSHCERFNAVKPDCWKNDSAIPDSFKSARDANMYPIENPNPVKSKVHVFTAFDSDGTSYRVGVDSFAEISLISPQLVKNDWSQRTGSGMRMKGIGKAVVADHSVTVPLKSQWGAPTDYFDLFALEPPHGVDILMGLDIQDKLGTIINREQATVSFTRHKLVIKTEPSILVTRRMQVPPITVVATNSGCNFAYAAVRNTGLRVKQWFSIEQDETCRRVSDTIVPENQLIHFANDTKDVGDRLNDVKVDLFIDTSPCQPWSRCRGKAALGFKDKRSETFVHANNLYKKLRKTNPDIRHIVENVVPAKHLSADFDRMVDMWEGPFHEINAMKWKSGASRPRNYNTNICHIPDIPTSKPINPEAFIDDDVYCKDQVVRCIVASDTNTHNPPIVHMRDNDQQRYLKVVEAEALQGWPHAISNGGSKKLGLDRATRMRLIGNAVCHSHVREILGRWNNDTENDCIVAPIADITPSTISNEDLEHTLSTMSIHELRQWVNHRLEGYTLPELDIEIEEGAGPYAKPGVSYSIPSGQVHAVMYQMAQMIDKGYLREINFEHGMWVSPGFGKSKGRTWPGTDIMMFRILSDLRKLNAAIKKPPAHWVDSVVDARELAREVPSGSQFFLPCDISDAFSTCRLTERAQKLCVIELNGKFFMYLGGPQGLAPMALFWNAHIQDGFFKVLGTHWKKWWITFVDDMGVHAMTEASLTNRARILSVILDALGKPHAFGAKGDSDVTTWEAKPQESMVLAGLHYDRNGIKCNEEIIEALRRTLTEFKVTTKTDAQHVVGVIQYSHTAFEWSDDAYTRYSSLMRILTSATKVPEGKHVKWGEDCIQACLELYEHITNRPMAYWSPFNLITDDNCLVSMTDASDDAVSGSLFVVRKPDARDVTMEDLKNPQISTLISVNSKMLDEGQRKWGTYEVELFGMVRTVEKHGKFITTATAKYPTSGPNFKAKVGFLSDSTTAIGRWKSLTLPIGVIDFLSAKARRFYSWADICAGTKYWPFCISHLSGDDISLPHMLTHLGDLAKERQSELKSAGIEYITMPMFLHSYHNGHQRDSVMGAEERGYTFNSLQLTPDDVQEIHRAYLDDDSEYSSVQMKLIYRIIALNDTTDIPSDVIKKVEAWRDTMFFVHTLPNTEHPILYTPASLQILMWPDTGADNTDLTKMLVTVIPDLARVKITSTESIVDDSLMEKGHHMNHDLRMDVLMLSHNCAQHPSLAQTIRNVAATAWFPGIKSYVADYYNSCTICLPKRDAHRSVGISIMAARRFKVIQIDHKILDGDIAKATGIPAILTIICMATRMAIYIPVSAVDTITTAMKFMTSWYPILGLPAVIRSDRGSAFASKLMAAVRSLLGIKEWDASAAGDAQHHSLLENKHKTLDSTLDMAMNKGDLTSATELEFYTAAAMARNNLDMLTDSATAFERATGEIPRTLMDMATFPQHDSEMAELKPADTLFINRLKDYITGNLEWLHFVNSERVRKDVGHKLVASERKRTTAFDFHVNDMVSYRGAAVKIMELLHPFKYGHAKAKIRTISHDEASIDIVNYSDLTPIGDARPELMIDRQLSFETGSFIFYETEEGTVLAGTIMNKIGVELTVHSYRQAMRRDRRFVPLYTLKNGKIEPKEKPPQSASPVVVLIPQTKVLASTRLEKYMIPDAALPALQSRGVIVNPLTVDDESVMFPIQAFTKREQVEYMMILRKIAHKLHVPPFGPTATILEQVHRQAMRTTGLRVWDGDSTEWDPSVEQLYYIADTLGIIHHSNRCSRQCRDSVDDPMEDNPEDVSPQVAQTNSSRTILSLDIRNMLFSVDIGNANTQTVVFTTIIVYVTWIIMQKLHSVLMGLLLN